MLYGTALDQQEDQPVLPHNSLAPHQQQASNGFGLLMPQQQMNNAASSFQPFFNILGCTPQHMLQEQLQIPV